MLAGIAPAPMANPLDPQQLLRLVTVQMPYGKYQGRVIADLPGHYLNWFAREGFPAGDLGRLLALMQTIDHNGLKGLLQPLRNPPPPAHTPYKTEKN